MASYSGNKLLNVEIYDAVTSDDTMTHTKNVNVCVDAEYIKAFALNDRNNLAPVSKWYYYRVK